MDKSIVFQATKRYRRQYTLIALGGLVLATYLGFSILLQERSVLAGAFSFLLLLGVGFWGFRIGWISPQKLQICLHNDRLLGSNGRGDFQTPYSKILHIENTGYALQIDTTDGFFWVEERYFPLESIQKELEKRLHPDVFTEKGWLNLPVYQEVLEQQEALYSELLTKLPLRINQELTTTYKIFVAIITVLFSAATFLSWHQLGYGSLLFLFFALLSVIILLRQGVLEVDNQQISYETRFRKLRILWENVTHVEYDDILILAFRGQKQCLKIPSTLDLRQGKEKDHLYFFLDQMIKEKNIERRRSSWASFRFNKNTRVVE